MQKKRSVYEEILGIFTGNCAYDVLRGVSKPAEKHDYNLVYKKAIEYYNKGDYQRAMNLLDGVRSVFVGQAKAQNIAYYRAFCSYNMKDYQIASDLFKQFIQTYPESSFAEECLYMMGFCDYKASPKPRLDQQVTEKAIREFQLYLSRYPYSMQKR